MKNNKQKKSFILFISVFTAAMLLFSISSCEFFSFSELPEVESQEDFGSASSASLSTPKASRNGKIKLSFTPHFQNKEQSSGRSAYPEFSSAQIKNLKYTIECSSTPAVFESANGSYNETDGTIDFEISSGIFSNLAVTIYAKNASDQILFYATTTLTYSTIAAGAEITSSIYFKPYDSSVNPDTPPNGFINLQISTSTGYTINCELENNQAGKITVTNNSSNKCTISTVSDGVSPRDYKAKISIKSGSNIVDFRIQTIYVWPGMTTDCWYLSNGDKSSNYNIEVNSCQLYVMGENPTGLYSPEGLPAVIGAISPSDSNDGTILKPLATINDAIAKCANDNKTDYIIICDGDLPGFTIGENNPNTASKRKLTIKGGGNSDNYSKITSSVSFNTTNNIIFENLKFSNLSGTYSIYGTFFTNGGKKLALNNCHIENDTNSNIGIGCNGSVSYSLELNDTTIYCTKRDALNLNNNNATSTKTLRIKGSTFIQPYFDDTTNKNENSIVGPTKIIIDGPLTDSHTILGSISLGSGYEPGYQLMTAVNGANLAKESRRFEVIDFPKILNTDGKVELSKDFYVAESTATPAGSPSGTGSATRPLDTVTAAVAKINEAANSADGAGDYTIHISGLIKENDTINLVGSSGGTLSSFYSFNSTSPSTLTLCGTNKDNDKLDGNGTHQVLKIQGNPSYSLPVTIENLTIQNGNADSGGGIYVTNAIVKLGNGCVITQNENSASGYGGGGVYLNNADLFMYGDALIGYDAAQVYTTTSDAKTKGGNIAAGYGAAIYAAGSGNANPSKTNIWIGYTAENIPDTDPDKFPKISGNCSALNGGAIYVNSYSSLYMCKGEISYNYARSGGGLYAYYRSYAHFYRNFYGGLIKGNQALNGGGIYLTDAGNGSAGFLHLSGDTVIEENEATGANGKGGAIYGASEIEIKDSVYIPFIDNKKNDVYLPQDKKIKILDTLTPPAAANGITATITPATYSDTTVLLKDSETDAGAKVAANYDKFAVTPEGTKRWKLDSEGIIYLPFNAKVNDVTYTKKADCIAAITDTSLSGQDITVTVLEADVSDFGPSDTADTILNAISTTTAKTVDLNIDENANIKLPASSSGFFRECYKLYNVNLAGIDTSEVTDMEYMFGACFGYDQSSFPEDAVLDIRNFNTSNVTNMCMMFSYSKLKTIIVGSDFVINPGINSDNMFYDCNELTGAYGTIFDGVHMDAEYARIDGGTSNPGYFTAANYIGSKRPLEPKEVGDIVFNDGSSMPYTEFTALDTSVQDEKKTAAIALIFYKGTGLNSDNADGTSDNTTTRTLGVGLQHRLYEVRWCKHTNATDYANAYDKNIITIQCSKGGSFGSYIFTGDKNGKDNLEQIGTYLANNSSEDDTVIEDNYPAFYFGKNYMNVTGSNVSGTAYENGWYLPSVAELYQIYTCMADPIDGFNVDLASEALGGDKFGDKYYWSSTQYPSDDNSVYHIKEGSVSDSGKGYTLSLTCCIREF